MALQGFAKFRVAGVAAALMLGGCQTSYQDGTSAEQITSDTFRIAARGNGFTEPKRVQDFVLMKAAELTIAKGATHFVLISATDASSSGTVSTPGTAHTSMVGNTAFTTITPGSSYSYVRPGQDAYIRVLKPPAGQIPANAMNAADVIKFTAPRLKTEG